MPKMKTHKGAAKRMKKTGTGKIKYYHSHATHLKTKKSRKRKRHLKKSDIMSQPDAKRMKKLLP